jgi:chaperonin GroES
MNDKDEVTAATGKSLTISGPETEIQRPHRRMFDMSLETKMAESQPTPIRRQAKGFMPMNGQVLVRLCTLEEMSESGVLFIPETAKEKPVEGIVLTTSRGRIDRNGNWIPTELEAADHVIFGKYSGAKLTLRGEEVRMLREDEILGVMR